MVGTSEVILLTFGFKICHYAKPYHVSAHAMISKKRSAETRKEYAFKIKVKQERQIKTYFQ